MDNSQQKVCIKCGTLNDERSLMCVRCGQTLEISEEEKYKTFKDKMMNEKLFLFLFSIFFFVYSVGVVLYGGSWFHNILIELSEKYILNLFENSNMIFIALEVIYTLVLCTINYIATAIILYSTMGQKLLKRKKLNGMCLFIYIFMILSFIIISIYKHKLNYLIIIEHFISIIITFPYIKGKILKRSI